MPGRGNSMCKVLRLEEAVREAAWLEGSEWEEGRAGRRWGQVAQGLVGSFFSPSEVGALEGCRLRRSRALTRMFTAPSGCSVGNSLDWW